MKKCLFCERKANTLEHLWPEWVLKKTPAKRIRGFVGRHKDLAFERQFTVRCVCERCNGGWMSDLEQINARVIGAMVDDRSIFLDVRDQSATAGWALKTAVILDSVTVAPQRPIFYSAAERESLRDSLSIPTGTTVWLGRYLTSGLAAASSGAYYRLSGRSELEVYTGHVTTLVVGNLVLQVLTLRSPSEYQRGAVGINSQPGPWEELLVPCWPPSRAPVYWPPILAFDDSGTAIDIRRLFARWKIGKERKIF